MPEVFEGLKASAGLREVLKRPQFVKLWIGQIISSVGDRFTQMALLGLLIGSSQMEYEMSRITFFSLLPALLFGNLAGALLDRLSRRRVMVASDVLRALLVGAMAWVAADQTLHHPALLYTFMFVIGICSAFFAPARLAIVPALVEPHQLQAANALVSGTGTMATLIGTYLAGVVVEGVGTQMSFTINAATYLVSAIAIGLIRVSETHLQPTIAHPRSSSILMDARDAMNYLRHHSLARQAIGLSVALSFLSSFFYVTLISLGVRHFGLSTGGVGLFLAVLGFGMVAGSLSAPYVARFVKSTRILANGFVVIALTSLLLAGASSSIMASILLFILGMANEIIVVTLDTLLQRITPDRFRGKLFGLRTALTTAMFLGPLLASGWLLSQTSPSVVLRGLAVLSLLTASTVLIAGERFAYLIFRILLRGILRLLFRVQIEGEQYVRHRGALILAGNHTGFLDGPLVIAACRRPVRFLVARKVFSWPGVGRLVRMAGAIPVGGAHDGAYQEAQERLRRGELIGMFPEGRLTLDGKMGPFKRGTARLHIESRVPIVPFVIHGGFEAWPAKRYFPMPRRVVIQFGVPIEPGGKHDKMGNQNKPIKDEHSVTQDLHERIEFMQQAIQRRQALGPEQAFAESVLQLMQTKSDGFAARTALCLQEGEHWKEWSYAELSRRARKAAAALVDRGVEPNDRVALLSESRPEWSIGLFAAIRAGAIVVPLDVKLGQTELTSILSDCQPKVLVASAHYLAMARTLAKAVPSIQHVLALEEGAGLPDAPSLENLRPGTVFDSRERHPDETALIIYTSGTTGSPKGVETTFGNLIFQVKNFERLVDLGPQDRFLSILPLNHLLELTGGLLGALHTGGMICYAQSLYPYEILRCMRERKITVMIGVPLFYKTLKNSIEKQVRGLHATGRFFFRCAWLIAAVVPSRSLRRLLFFRCISNSAAVCGRSFQAARRWMKTSRVSSSI